MTNSASFLGAGKPATREAAHRFYLGVARDVEEQLKALISFLNSEHDRAGKRRVLAALRDHLQDDCPPDDVTLMDVEIH